VVETLAGWLNTTWRPATPAGMPQRAGAAPASKLGAAPVHG
jgi:hypothetical protein